MDLVSPPNIEKATEKGFIVFLDDPLNVIIDDKRIKGQRAPPGLVTTIKSELIRFQRSALYTAWHGGTTHCPKMPKGVMIKNDPERFSLHGCGAFYLAQMLMKTCGCKWLLTEDFPDVKYCDPAQQYKCILPSCLKTNLTEVSKNCLDPCISYHYRADASYVGLGLSNTSRIEIVYNAKQYISLEYRTTTLSGLFSQVGGAMGLYLGASIITFAEVVIFAVSWLWYRIVPSTSPVLPMHHTKKMLSPY
ncbi:hypothetical protein JTE90_008455 [Oedothorax gibbosus]|uniref:Uncharacterized protein n=1 Tax=Oedothorax gibbosus TaxID=931172 RepID=A0AAV6V0I6_9ARAC|nr:hypothetical protein JTE90_008455 [Oedothorax gibbosus]